MPLPQNMMTQFWEVGWKHGLLKGIKPYHWAVGEAADPHGMVPTSTSNINKAFYKIFICCGWLDGSTTKPLSTISNAQSRGELTEFLSSWVPDEKEDHVAVVEAIKPPEMVPMIDNVHMLWMGRRIHHHAISNKVNNTDLGSWLESWVAHRHQTIPLSSGWGCTTTLSGPQIHLQYELSVWQPSYDMDG